MEATTMAGLRGVLVLAICIALVDAAVVGGVQNLQSKNLPCPEPDDILPCVCSTVEEDGHIVMDMDCSAVTDTSLASVFQASFPFTAFRTLTLDGNDYVKTLKKGDLGPVSFKNIFFNEGVLEEVSAGALQNSFSTLQALEMPYNKISKFPFVEIEKCENLETFDLRYNNFQHFPTIASNSLKSFNMFHNSFGSIPVDGFDRMPNLESISLEYCELKDIKPGTFQNLAFLNYLNLYDNELTHLAAGSINLNGNEPLLNLFSNHLTTLEAGAITGTNGKIQFNFNQLTVLDEQVFRPLLDAQNRVILGDNPLTCGCDVAWLITNPEYLSYAVGGTCVSGERLSELDANIYLDLC